jgi:hypothetical protein
LAGIGLILADKGCEGQIVIMSGTHPELLNSTSRLGLSFDLNVVGTLKKPFRASELRDALRLFGAGKEGRGSNPTRSGNP